MRVGIQRSGGWWLIFSELPVHCSWAPYNSGLFFDPVLKSGIGLRGKFTSVDRYYLHWWFFSYLPKTTARLNTIAYVFSYYLDFHNTCCFLVGNKEKLQVACRFHGTFFHMWISIALCSTPAVNWWFFRIWWLYTIRRGGVCSVWVDILGLPPIDNRIYPCVVSLNQEASYNQ